MYPPGMQRLTFEKPRSLEDTLGVPLLVLPMREQDAMWYNFIVFKISQYAPMGI
jgi:hypothetical protein